MSWKLKISKNSEKSKIFPSGSKPGFTAVKSGNQKPLTTNQIDMRSNPDGGIIFLGWWFVVSSAVLRGYSAAYGEKEAPYSSLE